MAHILGISLILCILVSHIPTIDFIIITHNDAEAIGNKPDNVKIIYRTLEEIKAAASEKPGFAVNIDYDYKHCNFKPAYGFIFPEIVADYNFWGHGDIDVVYETIIHNP